MGECLETAYQEDGATLLPWGIWSEAKYLSIPLEQKIMAAVLIVTGFLLMALGLFYPPLYVHGALLIHGGLLHAGFVYGGPALAGGVAAHTCSRPIKPSMFFFLPEHSDSARTPDVVSPGDEEGSILPWQRMFSCFGG